MDPIQLAAMLVLAAVLASIVSVEFGISVAVIELALGVVIGNVFDVDPNQEWLKFIAGIASIVLTFLAGAEVDPDDFRERFGLVVSMGLLSFVGPFLVAGVVTYSILGWSLDASLIAGTALSTTSIAVVYSVLVETGLNATRVGKLIMGACFVTDLAMTIVLSAIFIQPNSWFPLFLGASAILIIGLPRVAKPFFRRYGNRVIEPEIKLVLFCLLALIVLADAAKGHAIMPAFLLGLVMAKHFQSHPEESARLRVVAFAFLTPFFFLRGGMNVSLEAVFASLGVLALLFISKVGPKVALVFPMARRATPRNAQFITLLMSTGLTFGTIASLYGLGAGLLDQSQFSLLIATIILSAIVPTAVAQRWFAPNVESELTRDRADIIG